MPGFSPNNVLPLIPNAISGSPTPFPLVSAAEYQQVTKDVTTDMSYVNELLAEALEDLSHKCQRTFIYGQYTESQRLYPNGMVYPSATPIDINQAIFSGTEIYNPATDNTGSSIVQGDGVWVGWFSPLPWMPYYTGVVPAQTVITYWGGFQNPAVASPGFALPSALKRLICKIAFYRANPVMLANMPGGVKSMSVNGVSISGDLSSLMDYDAEVKKGIMRWRHAHAQAWQT
jgi:hypothetical protein